MNSACSWSTCWVRMIRIRFLTIGACGVGWPPCFLNNSPLPMSMVSGHCVDRTSTRLARAGYTIGILLGGHGTLSVRTAPKPDICSHRYALMTAPLSPAKVICSTNWRRGSSSFRARHLSRRRDVSTPIHGLAARGAGPAQRGKGLPVGWR